MEPHQLSTRDIISIDSLSKADIEFILEQGAAIEQDGYNPSALTGTIVGSLFFEVSTRTRISFETAAQRLGAGVVGFAGTESTSMNKKGESFEDTIKVIDGYVNCIVIRHPEIGSAKRAANVASVPVINAGDGPNEHPTQTLLDLYTILQTQGRLDGLTIGIVGDLKYGRVPHSLAKALAHWPDTNQIWVSPDSLAMPKDIKAAVENAGVSITETTDLISIMPEVDVLITTRVQAERFTNPSEYEAVKDVYVITPQLVSTAKSTMKIMNALPRRYELPVEIDALPQAHYFQQAANGVPVRAALLQAVLGN